MKKVGVIMGSDSDLPVVEKAIDKLKEYGVPYEVHVYSAHRTPVQAGEFARTAQENGFGAIIAAAGKAAHLAGALAANTTSRLEIAPQKPPMVHSSISDMPLVEFCLNSGVFLQNLLGFRSPGLTDLLCQRHI